MLFNLLLFTPIDKYICQGNESERNGIFLNQGIINSPSSSGPDGYGSKGFGNYIGLLLEVRFDSASPYYIIMLTPVIQANLCIVLIFLLIMYKKTPNNSTIPTTLSL